MTITYTAQNDNKGMFSISLEKNDIEQENKKVILQYSETLDLKGFRKGKIPRDIIEKKIGAIKLIEKSIERALPRMLDEASREHHVDIYGQPDIKITKLTETGPFELEASFIRLPKVTLTTYTGFDLKRKEVAINPEDVTRSLEELRNLGAEHTKVDRASQHGDKVTVDFEAFLDNIPLEGGKATNHPIILGESRNMFVPGFEKNIIGLKGGEKKEFNVRFPKDYGKKDLANRDVNFKVHVHDVHEVKKPDLSDELAKKLGGFESLDTLKKQLEENIKQDAEQKEEQRFELELIQKMLSKNSFETIPQPIIDDELHRMMHEMKDSVEKQGGKFEEYLQSIKKTEDVLKKDFTPKAIERIKTALIMRDIAEKEKLQAKPNEIDAIVEQEKLQHKDKPEILEQLNAPTYRRHIANVLTSRNVLQYLKEHNTKK